MKRLGVCGCSWMAATKNGISADVEESFGKHFTELVANQLGYEYLTYAKGSASNSCIRLQISQIIKDGVDFLIVGTTTSNRLDFPLMSKKFNIDQGIFNFDYSSHKDDQSYNDKKFTNNNFLSESISNFLETDDQNILNRYHISKEQLSALKYYFQELFDFSWRDQQDMWIIESAIKEIEDSKIPYILFPAGLLNFFRDKFPDSNKRFIWEPDLQPWNWEKGNRRWHTTDKAQEEGAKKIIDYIKKHNLI